MAELSGRLLQLHLCFVDFAGFDAVECGHAILGTNLHATVSDFSRDTEAFGVHS